MEGRSTRLGGRGTNERTNERTIRGGQQTKPLVAAAAPLCVAAPGGRSDKTGTGTGTGTGVLTSVR